MPNRPDTGGNIRFAPEDGTAQRLIVVLHGVGSNAAAMAPVGAAFAEAFPDAAVAVLNGYDAFDLGGAGRQWFSVKGVTEANRAERIAEALPRVEAVIEAEGDRWGVGMDRTVVAGFSQGAIMALSLALSSAHPPRAVVSLAGRIAQPVPVAKGTRPPVFLGHGTDDAVMAFAEMETARAVLTAAGCTVETLAVPDLGHSVHPSEIERAVGFVRAVG